MTDELFEELDRCYIQPLQIVDKESKRVLFLSTSGKKFSKHGVKTTSRFVGMEIRDRRLLADY